MDEVDAGVTPQGVVAVLTEDGIAVVAAEDVVGALATADRVRAAVAVDGVVTPAADDDVRFIGALDDDGPVLVRGVERDVREPTVAGSAEGVARWSPRNGQARDIRRGGHDDHDTAATPPQPDATCHVCASLLRGRGSRVAAASAPLNRDRR